MHSYCPTCKRPWDENSPPVRNVPGSSTALEVKPPTIEPSQSFWLEGEHFRVLTKTIVMNIISSCTRTETAYHFPNMNRACSMFARFHGTKEDLRKFVHMDDFRWSYKKQGQTEIKPRSHQIIMDDGSVVHILNCSNPYLSYFKKYIFVNESSDNIYVVYISSEAVISAEIPSKKTGMDQAGEVLEENLVDYEYGYNMDTELDPVPEAEITQSPPVQSFTPSLEAEAPTLGPNQWVEGEYFRVLSKKVILNIISRCTETQTTHHFPNMNRACSMFARFHGTKKDLRKFVRMDDFRWNYKKRGETEIKPRSTHILMDDRSVFHILNCVNPYLYYFKKYIFVNEYSDNIYVVYISSQAVHGSEIPKRKGIASSEQAGEVQEDIEQQVPGGYHNNMDTEPIRDPVPEVPIGLELAESIEQSTPVENPPGSSRLAPSSLEVEAPTLAPSQWLEGKHFAMLSKTVISNIISSCTTTQTTYHFPNMNRSCSMFARFHGTKKDLRKFVRIDNFMWYYKKQGETEIKPRPNHNYTDDGSLVHILNCVNPYLSYFKKYIFFNEASDYIYVVYVSSRAVDSSEIPSMRTAQAGEVQDGDKLQNVDVERDCNNLEVPEETLELAHINQEAPKESLVDYEYGFNMDTEPILDPTVPVVLVDPELAEIQKSPLVLGLTPPEQELCLPVRRSPTPSQSEMWLEGEHFRSLSKIIISKIMYSCTVTETTYFIPRMDHACSKFARFHGTKKDLRKFVHIDDFKWSRMKPGQTHYQIKPRASQLIMDDGSVIHTLNCPNPFLSYFKKYIFLDESCDEVYVVYVSSQAVDRAEIPLKKKFRAQAGEVQDWDEYGKEASEAPELAQIKQEVLEESLEEYEYEYDMDIEPILDPVPKVPDSSEIEQEVPKESLVDYVYDYNMATEGIPVPEVPVGSELAEMEYSPPAKRFRRSSPTLEPTKSMWLEEEYFRGLTKTIILRIISSCTTTETVSEATYRSPNIDHACSKFARFHGTKEDLRNFVHIDDLRWYSKRHEHPEIKPRQSQIKMDDGSVTHVLKCTNPYLRYFKKYIFLKEFRDEIYVVYVSSQAVDSGAEITSKNTSRAPSEPVGEVQEEIREGDGYNMNTEARQVKQEVPGDNKKSLIGMLERF